jgi:hypothetical protein
VVRDLSILHSPQTSSGAYPASYTKGTRGSFSGEKSDRDVKLTTHLHPVLKLRMLELYLHFSTRLQDVEII